MGRFFGITSNWKFHPMPIIELVAAKGSRARSTYEDADLSDLSLFAV